MQLMLLLSSTLLLGLNALGLTAQRNSCWDNSYDFKVSSFHIYGDRLEIGAKGTMLFNSIDQNLWDDSGLALKNDLYSEILLAFSAADCSEDLTGEISCFSQSQQPYQPLRSTMLVSRQINNLGQWINAFTPVPIGAISVRFSTKSFSATIFQYDYGTTEMVKKAQIDFATFTCYEDGRGETNTDFGTVYFTPEVRNYVASNCR